MDNKIRSEYTEYRKQLVVQNFRTCAVQFVSISGTIQLFFGMAFANIKWFAVAVIINSLILLIHFMGKRYNNMIIWGLPMLIVLILGSLSYISQVDA